MNEIKKDSSFKKKRNLHLIIDLSWHLIISSLAFVIIYIFFKSWKLALLAFFSGTLIDLDHLVDYFLVYKINFRPEKFFKGYQFLESRRVYVFLHGWEWIGVVLLVGFLAGFMPAAIAIALGIFGHLVVDQTLGFRHEPLFYFLTYRIIKKFKLDVLDKNFKKKWKPI